MYNKIKIELPVVHDNRIDYHYNVQGEWVEAFNLTSLFSVEYNCDISDVPQSVAIIPLLANVLPMSWIYDAEVEIDSCDKSFYDSIEDIKRGYIEMYPTLEFKGSIKVDKIHENRMETAINTASFFSGGVDAFNTLVCHADEKPMLITLWGADIKLDDTNGWSKVQQHLVETSKEFDVEFRTVKSNFRVFLNEAKLTEKVKKSGDGWWHGFQHGIGIICQAAPLSYSLGLKKVYFASSFTAAEKGKVTCASDPTIDNFIRFCDTQIIHDGYEYNRQLKIRNIVNYKHEHTKQIQLRVCWESKGGGNCCYCEKCWRTILGIYAEGENPNNFGFSYTNKQLGLLARKMRYSNNKLCRKSTYRVIQTRMIANCSYIELPKEIRWFYKANIDHLGNISVARKVLQKTRKFVRVLIESNGARRYE